MDIRPLEGYREAETEKDKDRETRERQRVSRDGKTAFEYNFD